MGARAGAGRLVGVRPQESPQGNSGWDRGGSHGLWGWEGKALSCKKGQQNLLVGGRGRVKVCSKLCLSCWRMV